MNRLIRVLAVCATLAGGSAFAQCDSGCGSNNNCGREISNSDAVGLWDGYCTETCYDHGSHRTRGHRGLSDGFGGGCDQASECNDGCGLSGRSGFGARGGLRSRGGMFGGNNGGFGGGCGCDQGCFGYPGSCGGCGNDSAGGFGGRLGGRAGHGSFHRNGGCGSECGGGFLSRLFQHHGSRQRGRSGGLFATSADNCGCSGAYFGEAVGYEYGNAGMQSYVAGSGCDGGLSNVGQPVMSHPVTESHDSSVIEGSPIEQDQAIPPVTTPDVPNQVPSH